MWRKKDKRQWDAIETTVKGLVEGTREERCFSDALSAAFQKSSGNFKIRYLAESSADEQLLFRVFFMT